MLDTLLNLVSLQDFNDYFRTVLSLAGVLLGLAYAALLYILQGGFASLKFSRPLLLKLYALFGRHLLITLSYLTLISLGGVYFPTYLTILSVVYYIFCVMFLKSFLDLIAHQGYIETLFSNKFIPAKYGPFRQYWRKIRNAGLVRSVAALVYFSLFIVYPILVSAYESGSIIMSIRGIFYSTLFLTVYTIIRLANFPSEFFALLQKENSVIYPSIDNGIGQEEGIDYVGEKRLLTRHMQKNGLPYLNTGGQGTFLDGTVQLSLREDTNDADAFLVIIINVHNANVFDIRRSVDELAVKLFRLLQSSIVGINSFVLSFNIMLEGEVLPRNIVLRSNRGELEHALSTSQDAHSVIQKIKAKFFDELFRDLPPTMPGKVAQRTNKTPVQRLKRNNK